MKNKIVIIAPHPDDETLGCGGTIMKKISEGYEVHIVVLTDGRNAFSSILNIEVDPTPEELKIIRANEIKDAANILGVPENNIYFLNFKDGEVEKHSIEVISNITKIFQDLNPVEIYCPSYKDANRDHRAAYKVVKEVIEEIDLKTNMFTYSIIQKYPNSRAYRN